VIERVGDGVGSVAPGDHIGVSWIPACGRCRWCGAGQSNLCDLGANMLTGELAAGGFRFHREGEDFGGEGAIGTFSQYTVVNERSVVKVDRDIPLEWVSLVTCAVATGWGSVINSGQVRSGDTVIIYGCGGIGSNAVQAAANVGARLVAVVEPVDWKREVAKNLGADLTFPDARKAQEALWEETGGVGMDVSIITVGSADAEVVAAAFEVTRKGGTIVLTAVSDDMSELSIQLPGSMLTLFQKKIVGSLFGACNPHVDIPRLLDLARAGKIRLAEMVTARYPLDQVNEGFADLEAGRNLRGVIVHEHS
jgi:NDMA-dependent alcohol dehydrogenase